MRSASSLPRLLRTLSTTQLFELLLETNEGAKFLRQLVSVDMSGVMDDVIASDQVFVITNKRWEGALSRTCSRGNTRDGDFLPLQNTFVLTLLNVFIVVPLNALILLPLAVAVPPLGKLVKEKFRKTKLPAWFTDFTGGNLKDLKPFYLLETPQFSYGTYILVQTAFTVLFVYCDMPWDANHHYGVWYRCTMLGWAVLAVGQSIVSAIRDFTSWQSDWLTVVELAGMATALYALGATYFPTGFLADYPNPEARVGTAPRSIAVCLLLHVQGYRLLQLSRTVGPLILMLKSMIFDFVVWFLVASVVVFSFSVSIWQTFQYNADDYTEDDCDISQHFDRSIWKVLPKLATAFLGGGEEYVPCFTDAQVRTWLTSTFCLLAARAAFPTNKAALPNPFPAPNARRRAPRLLS